jgi:hypothetical protein
MKHLITYHWSGRTDGGFAMTVANDPVEWLASVQEFDDRYILINAQPITDEQAKKYDGAFKGM